MYLQSTALSVWKATMTWKIEYGENSTNDGKQEVEVKASPSLGTVPLSSGIDRPEALDSERHSSNRPAHSRKGGLCRLKRNAALGCLVPIRSSRLTPHHRMWWGASLLRMGTRQVLGRLEPTRYNAIKGLPFGGRRSVKRQVSF